MAAEAAIGACSVFAFAGDEQPQTITNICVFHVEHLAFIFPEIIGQQVVGDLEFFLYSLYRNRMI